MWFRFMLASLAIRVVSLEIHGRNVLSLVVRGRNVFCVGSDFAFRHVRIFQEVIRVRVLSFVCKLVLAHPTDRRRKNVWFCMKGNNDFGAAGENFGV